MSRKGVSVAQWAFAVWPLMCVSTVFAQFGSGSPSEFDGLRKAADAARRGLPVPPAEPIAVQPGSAKVVIADEPHVIDPTVTLPDLVTGKATVEFEEASLDEVVEWLRTDRQLVVVVDKLGLQDDNLENLPITDSLIDEPLYFLLNRLRPLGIDWFIEDGVLEITSDTMADEHQQTLSYPISDLRDQDYTPSQLIEAIQLGSSAKWETVDGASGEIIALGDVLFVRNSIGIHQEIAALLEALRHPARRTVILEPLQHDALQAALQKPVTVEFQRLPLTAALKELSEQASVPIRLDFRSEPQGASSGRMPVTLKLSGQSLQRTLEILLASFSATTILRDNAIVAIPRDEANEIYQTAVFDVRDLCRDEQESAALERTLASQTNCEVHHRGSLHFPKPGILIARQTRAALDEATALLEVYRQALRSSRPGKAVGDPLQAVVTRYYRLPQVVAEPLVDLLPKLIKPETWKSSTQAEAIGTIQQLPSTPGQLKNAYSPATQPTQQANIPPATDTGPVIDYSVLMIHQTRATHWEIEQLLHRIERGDPPIEQESASGGLGGGMGGFGGGFFSVPEQR